MVVAVTPFLRRWNVLSFCRYSISDWPSPFLGHMLLDVPHVIHSWNYLTRDIVMAVSFTGLEQGIKQIKEVHRYQLR